MRSIMHANRLHLLLPFALPAAADASTALHDIQSPALDPLIARATLVERVVGEDFQRTLPHERWVARQFGALPSGAAAADEAPLAPYMLRADGGDPGGDLDWQIAPRGEGQMAQDAAEAAAARVRAPYVPATARASAPKADEPLRRMVSPQELQRAPSEGSRLAAPGEKVENVGADHQVAQGRKACCSALRFWRTPSVGSVRGHQAHRPQPKQPRPLSLRVGARRQGGSG